MNLLDPTLIRDNVDYSFGDQGSQRLWCGYMKTANIHNLEFISKYEEVKKTKNVMTLFIDNIRLYRRPGIKYTAMEMAHQKFKKFKDDRVVELQGEDLLELCGKLSDMNFVIFTGFEDTPIDEEIFDKIPKNVLAIYASNSIIFGGKVKPIPYGIQRKLKPNDNRHELLKQTIGKKVNPTKLLYINHSVGNNPERTTINNYFSKFNWVTIEQPRGREGDAYLRYLNSILNHKFMICPSGNAIGCECHRDWELIYMKRVPIVKRSKYLEYIFKDIPVLFVDDYTDITEEFLIENDYLYHELQKFDHNKLDFLKIYQEILNNF
jgi:hypothetical protein